MNALYRIRMGHILGLIKLELICTLLRGHCWNCKNIQPISHHSKHHPLSPFHKSRQTVRLGFLTYSYIISLSQGV